MFTLNSNFEEGDTLYFMDAHTQDYRSGVVFQVVRHHFMTYYVLEVDTGPPINDTFLVMKSACCVFTAEEVAEKELVWEEDPID